MNNKLKFSLIATGIVTLVACQSTSVDMASATSVELPRAAYAPTAEEMTEEQRVVILPPEYDSALGQLASRQIHNNLEQAIIRSGTRVIERERAASMAEELIAAERSGQFRTEGPQVANLVVFSRVTNVGWGSSFTERDSYTDRKGNRQTTPAYCSYSGSVQVQLRAYELPNMVPVETFDLNGSNSLREDSNDRDCEATTGRVTSLITNAVEDALAQRQTSIVNALAPSFYVTERRNADNGKLSLFRITADSSRGAQEGRDVEIFRRELRTDPLTQREYFEELLIASGVISSQVDRSGSFIIVRDKTQADRIQLGDIAQIRQGNCPDGYMNLLGSCQPSLW